MKRYSYIDALRGIAILMVLAAHTTMYGINSYPDWFYNVISVYVGPRGVQLFYIVSAFTLCLSFSKRQLIEKHLLRNFYIRRFFRIAPLFYVAIIYYLWQQQYWNGNPNHFSNLNVLSTFSFINGFFPDWINSIVFGGWSVTIEAAFYLFFPFLFRQIKSVPRALVITLVIMIAMQVLRLFLLDLPAAQVDADIQTYLFQFFPSQLPVFLIGMTLFLLMTKKHFSNVDNTYIKVSAAMFIFLLCIQFVFHIKIIAGHYLYSLFFAALLFILSKYPHQLIVNPITTYLGKISFSIYLSHFTIILWLRNREFLDLYPPNVLVNYILRFILILLCSSVVSTILFYLIEQNGQKLGNKIIKYFDKNLKQKI